MAYIWLFISHFFLILPGCRFAGFGHALELIPLHPENSLPGKDVPGTDGLENSGLGLDSLENTGLENAGLGNAGLDLDSLKKPGLENIGLDNLGLENVGLGSIDLGKAGLGNKVLPITDGDVNLGSGQVAARAPQDANEPADPENPSTGDGSSEDQVTTTSDMSSSEPTDAGDGSDTSTNGDGASSDGGNSEDASGEADADNKDASDQGTYDDRGETPVTNYQPSIAPIENDADYPNYDGQVMNSVNGTDYQYQYQLLINAEANGDTISLPADYATYDTGSMLKCTALCNDWNQKHGQTVVCEAVSYYGAGECYLIHNLYTDANGRYSYYVGGSILGLVLRSPTYPEPKETSPQPDDGAGGEYTSTATTTIPGPDYTTGSVTVPVTVPQVTYSQKTILPTDAYGKTTVEVYISSCPVPY